MSHKQQSGHWEVASQALNILRRGCFVFCSMEMKGTRRGQFGSYLLKNTINLGERMARSFLPSQNSPQIGAEVWVRCGNTGVNISSSWISRFTQLKLAFFESVALFVFYRQGYFQSLGFPWSCLQSLQVSHPDSYWSVLHSAKNLLSG